MCMCVPVCTCTHECVYVRARVCLCLCVCVCVCVVSGRGVGRQEREALTWEESLGVWKGVKALQREILAGRLRCPLLASAGSTDFFLFLQEPAFSLQGPVGGLPAH